jgi:hypothetical protein
MCEVEKQTIDGAKVQKGSKHFSLGKHIEWVCRGYANGFPLKGPLVQEKAYYTALKMAFGLNVQIAFCKELCRMIRICHLIGTNR